MAYRQGNTGLNAACNGFVQAIDTGSTNPSGQISFYTGSQPSTPATSPTGTLLATAALNVPSFSAASSGVSGLVVSPAVNATVSAAGTPGYFRVSDRNGNAIADGSVTTTGSGGDMTFDNTTWVVSGVVTISSFTITFPM